MRDERRRSRRAASAGLAVLVLGTAAVVATYSPLFAADDISIAGADIPRGELLAIAGIDEGSNVFHLDTSLAERRLERDPRVLEATVTTSLPGTVRIRIASRMPVAVVGRPAELVGADGVVIGPAHGPLDPFPVIRGDDVRTAAAAAGAMGEDLRRRVEAIVVRPDGGVGVRLDAGFSADLGAASELQAKAASLAALLEWATTEGVEVVSADITVPGSPTAELDDGRTAEPST